VEYKIKVDLIEVNITMGSEGLGEHGRGRMGRD
jgi:hypothetical protein